MKKVTLIGIYPPPIGGISIYIKRVKKLLEYNGYYCEVYNEGEFENNDDRIYRMNSYKNLILNFHKLKGDIIHFNCINTNIRAILWILKLFNRKKKMIITIHGSSLKDQLGESGFLKKYFIIKSLKSMDKIIVVNKFYKDLLSEHGIETNKIEFIGSFIKPISEKGSNVQIPHGIFEFLSGDEFKVITNGCIRFYNNEELYGFDNIIEAIYKLNKKGFNIKLLVAVLGVENQNNLEQKYYKNLKKKVENLNLDNKILFYEVNNTEFYPLLEKSDLFIRATNTDGDHPISLKEALVLKKPSIASDVSSRPDGCILYESRCVSDLSEKIEFVISNYDNIQGNLRNLIIDDSSIEIMNLYKSLV